MCAVVSCVLVAAVLVARGALFRHRRHRLAFQVSFEWSVARTLAPYYRNRIERKLRREFSWIFFARASRHNFRRKSSITRKNQPWHACVEFSRACEENCFSLILCFGKVSFHDPRRERRRRKKKAHALVCCRRPDWFSGGMNRLILN